MGRNEDLSDSGPLEKGIQGGATGQSACFDAFMCFFNCLEGVKVFLPVVMFNLEMLISRLKGFSSGRHLK